MKRSLALFLALALAVGAATLTPAYAYDSVRRLDTTIAGRGVSAVEVNLTDSDIRVFSVHANNKIGDTASLYDIAHQLDPNKYEVLAAINGTFFEAYNAGSRKPALGAVISNGEIINNGTATFIGFGLDNSVHMRNAYLSVTGTVGGIRDFYHMFYVAFWNIIPQNDRGEVLLTSAYGSTTGPTDRNVVDRKSVV